MTPGRTDVKIKVAGLSKKYYQHSSVWSKVAEHLGLPFGRGKLKELVVLNDLSLEVCKGERLGIIGRNGAGKSTLLRIVSGLLRPTAGSVVINGTINALFDTSTGFHPDFTGRQNVIVNLAYRGITGREAEKKVEEVIEFSELYDFIDQPFKTYSAGMMSRLTFSVATILKPDILIIDEILGAGDAYFAAKCLDRMKEITSGGATVLIVSHSLGAVLQFSTRAIWIDRGVIQADGRPIDVVEKYQQSVEHYERLRMMAKNARLHLKLSPATISGTYGRYLLFRLAADPQAGDETRVKVSTIRLLENGKERYRLDVGGPMDDSTAYPMFIAANQAETSWGKAERKGDHTFRTVRLGPGLAPANFLALFPLDTHPDDRYRLEVEACADRPTSLRLEAMNTAGAFAPVGTITLPTSLWSEQALDLPATVYAASTGAAAEVAATEPEPATDDTPPAPAPAAEAIRQQFGQDSGPVYVVRYTMYRGERKETTFRVGDSYVGEIDFYCEREIPMPVFVVNITRVDGIRMRQSLSHHEGLTGDRLKPGHGKVRVNLAPLYFGPGNYVVSVGVFESVDLTNEMTMSPPMSLRSNAFEFQVVAPTEVRVDMGCCQFPARWEHVRASA